MLQRFFFLDLKAYASFCSLTVEYGTMTWYLKNPGFVDLLIACVFLTEECGDDTACCDILFRW